VFELLIGPELVASATRLDINYQFANRAMHTRTADVIDRDDCTDADLLVGGVCIVAAHVEKTTEREARFTSLRYTAAIARGLATRRIQLA